MYKEDKKRELAARVAWLYYVAGKTQLEIAKILGLSRQVVQRLLSQARELGMVNVNITHPITECLKLANALQNKYSLNLCRIVPSANLDIESINDMIAVDGAEVMSQFIDDEQALIIGIGSGKTLRNIIDVLPESERSDHACVSFIGAIARDSSATRYDVPLRLAEKLHCKYFIIPAPLYAESQQDKTMWCQHKAYQDVKHKAEQADVTFIGIGELGIGCPLNAEGFITNEQVSDLVKKGAVAEILGHFISENGNNVNSEFDTLRTSVPLHPNTDKNIIAFAGGKQKYRAIKAILKGKWISGLVTDEETAQALLAEKIY